MSALPVVDDRILRLPEVIARVGIGRSTVLKQVKEGTFPAPVRLSAHTVGWKLSAIQEWLSTRESAA